MCVRESSKDLRGTGRVANHLIHADRGTALKVALQIAADPDNVGADGCVEASGDNIEGKVTDRDRFNGSEKYVALTSARFRSKKHEQTYRSN